MTDTVIFLASYPKSGNTWIRRMIAEVLAPGGRVKEAIPSFGKTFPEDSPRWTLFGRPTRIIKTPFHPELQRFRTFTGDIAGAISIRRHPLDVLLSSINFARLKEHAPSFIGGQPKSVEQILADGEMKHYVDLFVEQDGFPWFESQTGKFSAYQKRWRDLGARLPYLELSYEDTVADPAATLRRIIEFLGLDAGAVDAEAITRRIDARSQPNGRFIWSKRAYNFESKLPRDLAESFAARYAAVLDDLGYGS
jgi:hypothetical protein